MLIKTSFGSERGEIREILLKSLEIEKSLLLWLREKNKIKYRLLEKDTQFEKNKEVYMKDFEKESSLKAFGKTSNL